MDKSETYWIDNEDNMWYPLEKTLLVSAKFSKKYPNKIVIKADGFKDQIISVEFDGYGVKSFKVVDSMDAPEERGETQPPYINRIYLEDEKMQISLIDELGTYEDDITNDYLSTITNIKINGRDLDTENYNINKRYNSIYINRNILEDVNEVIIESSKYDELKLKVDKHGDITELNIGDIVENKEVPEVTKVNVNSFWGSEVDIKFENGNYVYTINGVKVNDKEVDWEIYSASGISLNIKSELNKSDENVIEISAYGYEDKIITIILNEYGELVEYK